MCKAEDLLNSEPAWRQTMTTKINVFVNEVAQKTDDLIVAKMTEHLTAHGYDKEIEINGANLRACIEKQIEKEPVIETMQGMNVRKCPECGRVLFSDRYCGDCGQLIKG